jgi:hypothetical protein
MTTIFLWIKCSYLSLAIKIELKLSSMDRFPSYSIKINLNKFLNEVNVTVKNSDHRYFEYFGYSIFFFNVIWNGSNQNWNYWFEIKPSLQRPNHIISSKIIYENAINVHIIEKQNFMKLHVGVQLPYSYKLIVCKCHSLTLTTSLELKMQIIIMLRVCFAAVPISYITNPFHLSTWKTIFHFLSSLSKCINILWLTGKKNEISKKYSWKN